MYIPCIPTTHVSSFIQGVGVVRLSGVEICGDEPWHLGLMEGVWWVNPPWLHHGKPTGLPSFLGDRYIPPLKIGGVLKLRIHFSMGFWGSMVGGFCFFFLGIYLHPYLPAKMIQIDSCHF